MTTQVETQHEDMVHDAQLDFYGKRLATCSSDKTVKVFDVDSSAEQKYHLVDTLRGHDGPVWQVAWAHPKFGSILASCSYDGKVFVWREATKWERIKEHTLHTASVNSISWAPQELGPILACASSDGKVSVLAFNDDGTWEASLFSAHAIGANAVSWSPATLPGSLTSTESTLTSLKRFASGGCDGLVKIWSFRDDTNAYELEDALSGHDDWVRDVAFAPGIGLARTYLASAGQDRRVNIWTQEKGKGAWTKQTLEPPFAEVVWRVSWSVSGNVLAVCAGDGKVTLWKENLKGVWECVSEMQQ